jgi:hypothetical protein
MKRKWFTKGLILIVVLFVACPSWAAHPLITDDTGTQGKGKFQLELTGQYDSDNDDSEGVSVKASGTEAAAALSYGIVDNVDLVLSLPYLWGKEKEEDVTVYDENGIGDAALEVKWRLFEKEGFSLALKPGISFPTGDDDKGLGTGKIGGQIFLIATEEIGSWAFHGNLGYIRNENDADELKDIWHASIAAQYEVIKDLNLVANIGMERNPDDEADDDPVFIIGGLIYSISENLDVDLGVKCGLTDSETDISALAGVAFRF